MDKEASIDVAAVDLKDNLDKRNKVICLNSSVAVARILLYFLHQFVKCDLISGRKLLDLLFTFTKCMDREFGYFMGYM